IDEALQKKIQDFAVRVGDAATEIREPTAFRTSRKRIGGVKGQNLRTVLGSLAIAVPLGKNHAARAGDANRLIQLLNRSLNIVVGFEHRVGIEDELDIGIELARLTFDRRRLSDRCAPLNRNQLDVLQRTERLGTCDGAVGTAVVNENDPPRTERLTGHRSE